VGSAKTSSHAGQGALLFTDPQAKQRDFYLPDLKSVKRLALDTETTGLHYYDKVVGISIYTDKYEGFYIPLRHKAGFNFDLDKVKEWAKDNLTGKTIDFCNGKFDIQKLRPDIDLEKLNVIPRDIANAASLLTSKRLSMKLEDIAQRELGKGKLENLKRDTTPFDYRPSHEGWDYAVRDAELTFEAANSLQRKIILEDLEAVLKLENELIYPICAYEEDGVRIDRTLLEVMKMQCAQMISTLFWTIFRETGLRVEASKPASVAAMCKKLGIEFPATELGKASIRNEWLEDQDHPMLRTVWMIRKLQDADSDYFTKYLEALDSNNRIRYNINQLRSDEFGAVTGRMSSSGSRKGADDDKKINVQQVKKKTEKGLEQFNIRQLFLPEEGCQWVSADASQLQFRIFAHYSNDERLISEYRTNPKADFHKLVAEKILRGLLDRDAAKHENFGNLFGMGVDKGARRLGVSVEEYQKIKKLYHSNFPAVKKLTYAVQGLARHPSLGPHPITNQVGRGYIKTISKRRRRYDRDDNLNSAFNAVIQGTEGDITKDKMVYIYQHREELGIRKLHFPVHDDQNMSIPTGIVEEKKKLLKELLDDHSSWENRFGVKFKVPIIWDVKSGSTWNMK
jgi:DNA polymerase-1